MMKESIMRKDDRAIDKKRQICILWVNTNLNDLFSYPLPKPYITSYIKYLLILRVVNCLH